MTGSLAEPATDVPAIDVPTLELAPVDITPWCRGNTDIDYVTTFDSGRPGPHLMINALAHGNEISGAHALKFLFEAEARPVHGKLTLSFANVAAYEVFDAAAPQASRYLDEDFNRLWGPDFGGGATARSRERARALAMLPVVREVDHLLDLHSMGNDGPPLLVSGPLTKSRVLAEALAYPGIIVIDDGHPSGVRLRDFGAWADPDRVRTAALVECGQHWRRSSVVVAIQTCVRFLAHFAAVPADFVAEHLAPGTPALQRVVEVSELVWVRHPAFRFVSDFAGLEVIAHRGTLIAYDGDEPVRTPHDDCVLVMPSVDLTPGVTAVRFGRFVA